MGLVIYDIDKIIRDNFLLKFGGSEYLISEPSLKSWGEINNYDLSKKIQENYLVTLIFLASKMCQEIVPHIENMTKSELDMLWSVMIKILSGQGAVEKKLTAPEEIMMILD